MTSSLVGSEMCIRDRYWKAPHRIPNQNHREALPLWVDEYKDFMQALKCRALPLNRFLLLDPSTSHLKPGKCGAGK
eukprot:9800008-Prorocentrum_lima.AAC.1